MNALLGSRIQSFTKTAKPPQNFVVTWYNKPIGVYRVSDNDRSWTPINPELTKNWVTSKLADVPAAIFNVHPRNSFFGQILQRETARDFIGKSLRTLCNVKITAICDDDYKKCLAGEIECINTTPLDTLEGTLDEYSHNGIFTGKYSGPEQGSDHNAFLGQLKRQWVEHLAHRFSGAESKLPFCLNKNGELKVANGSLAFTHIGKFGSERGSESIRLFEYMGIKISEAIGLETAKTALVKIDNDTPPMLLSERFDIPATNDDDDHYILLHDCHSLMGTDPQMDDEHPDGRHISYECIMKRWSEFVQEHDPENAVTHMRDAWKRLLLAWVTNDSDFHAKNMSARMRIDKNTGDISLLGLSPTYDTISNRHTSRFGSKLYFPLFTKGHREPSEKIKLSQLTRLMNSKALSINGNEYSIFKTKDEAEKFIRDIASTAVKCAVDMAENPPSIIEGHKRESIMRSDLNLAAAITCERAKSIGCDVPYDEDQLNAIWKNNRENGPKIRENPKKKSGKYRSGRHSHG